MYKWPLAYASFVVCSTVRVNGIYHKLGENKTEPLPRCRSKAQCNYLYGNLLENLSTVVQLGNEPPFKKVFPSKILLHEKKRFFLEEDLKGFKAVTHTGFPLCSSRRYNVNHLRVWFVPKNLSFSWPLSEIVTICESQFSSIFYFTQASLVRARQSSMRYLTTPTKQWACLP